MLLPFSPRLLRLWRERRGYLQADLARRCTEQGTPVSRLQVIRAETGRNRPQPRILVAFAMALGVEVEDLLAEPEEGCEGQDS